jgi:hypothetical protein
MKVMSRMAVLAAWLVAAGCASMGNEPTSTTPDNTPVGTSGRSTAGSNAPVDVSDAERGVIPVGQEIDVRMQNALSSKTATAEQRFSTTTVVDIMQDGRVLVPAGSTMRGIVRSVEPAGRVDRTGRLTLAFDQLQVNGRDVPFRGMATEVFQSGGIREEAATIGGAAAVGAIVGGIIGGVKGAVIGAAVGGGGVIAATEGKDVEIPAGAIVRVRVDSALRVAPRR